MELISKEAAVYRMKEAAEYPHNAVSKNSREALKKAEEILESMPTIEAEPVVHAHWEEVDDFWSRCSNCKELVQCGLSGGQMDRELEAFKKGETLFWGWCPHCRAKMDEVEE